MGLRNLPSNAWTINRGWVLTANIASDINAWTRDINAWTRLLGLHDQPDLATAEPDTLSYRLWHLPARLTNHARQHWLTPPGQENRRPRSDTRRPDTPHGVTQRANRFG